MLVSMKYWGVPMAFIFALVIADFALCVRGQTNLPTPPHVTAGADPVYDTVCKICEREAKLVPLSVKVLKGKPGLGVEFQTVRLTFRCINPKCGHKFTWDMDRAVRQPTRLPARPVAPIVAPPKPEPKKVLKAPKGQHE